MATYKQVAKLFSQTMREAQDHLEDLERNPEREPDYALLYRDLHILTDCCKASEVPVPVIFLTVRLYMAAGLYQEAATLLRRLRGRARADLLAQCDLRNSYYTVSRDWLSRQDEIWSVFRSAAPTLSIQNMRDRLQEPLAHCLPTQRFCFLSIDDGADDLVFLGTPDGVYSLFPMTYLLRHMPEAISEQLHLVLEIPWYAEGGVVINGTSLDADEVQVRVTPVPGYLPEPKVDLEFWHPLLQHLAEKGSTRSLQTCVDHLLNSNLSAVATALHVRKASAAEQPFGKEEDTMLLEDLEQWLEHHGMEVDASPDRILRNRVYAFTRAPVMVSRPRGDILRGETCMPELEEIYFLRNWKGLSSLQRYGVGCWFLTIPKPVCGEDFPAFRDNLIQAVRAKEQDTVCFTGWAEGTRNCYIDFLSLSSRSTLNTLQQYCAGLPGGKDIRISTFYWNAVPHTVNCAKETQKLEHLLSQLEKDPDAAEPPKEQVSPKSRAGLEKAFRETRWNLLGDEADWDIDAASSYDHALEVLEEATRHTLLQDMGDVSYDFGYLHSIVQRALPSGDAPGADDAFCIKMSTVLMSMEQYREAAKWASRAKSSNQRNTRLYTCDVGSDYPNGENQWEPRRQTYWKLFAGAESDLAQSLTGGGDPAVLENFAALSDAVFPRQEVSLIGPGSGRKYTLLTGLPGGILTLPALLYLTSHSPGTVRKRWNIAVSWDGAPLEHLPVGEETVSLQEVQVSLTDLAGKVSLALSHPVLSELARDDAEQAKHAATRLLNAALPMGARLLYVERITVEAEAPEDAFPLRSLRQQMKDRGYLPDVDLDSLLTRRKYTISRQGQYSGRPRSDILRGETCMPELECIYNRLYEEGQTILERHGLAALFLMIPNQLCGGDPAQYRQQLQRYITLAEGDKVFFTGWAEGSEYCYLDLISMHGSTLLGKLNEYILSNPEDSDLRLSSFFWNSKPRPWDILEAQRDLSSENPEEYSRFAKEHRAPDFPVPGAEAAAALEASFHAAFTPEDFCAPKAPEAPAAAPQKPAVGKKKLSKAQRKAQNSQGNGKNGKKKR